MRAEADRIRQLAAKKRPLSKSLPECKAAGSNISSLTTHGLEVQCDTIPGQKRPRLSSDFILVMVVSTTSS